MKIISIKLIFLLSVFNSYAIAKDCVEIGKTLPLVKLESEKSGELLSDGKTVEYIPWSSEQLTGKLFIIYHLAARMGVDEINQAFLDEMDKLESDYHWMVIYLNVHDVFVGGKYFARRTFEKNRRANDEVGFVLDTTSAARKAWCLNKKSSAIVVVDNNGKVLHFKDGKLTDKELEQFINTIKLHIRRAKLLVMKK